jgi:hypothetical protein
VIQVRHPSAKYKVPSTKNILDLVAVEGVEPSSLDYQSSALSLSYTARMVLCALYFVLCSRVIEIIGTLTQRKQRTKHKVQSTNAFGWSDGTQTRTSRLKRPLLCHSSSGPKEFLIFDF